MLPLASSASTIDTGCDASWNVSTFCATPSSTMSRSSAETSRYWPLESVAVNSSDGRTGAGFGAK